MKTKSRLSSTSLTAAWWIEPRIAAVRAARITLSVKLLSFLPFLGPAPPTRRLLSSRNRIHAHKTFLLTSLVHRHKYLEMRLCALTWLPCPTCLLPSDHYAYFVHVEIVWNLDKTAWGLMIPKLCHFGVVVGDGQWAVGSGHVWDDSRGVPSK